MTSIIEEFKPLNLENIKIRKNQFLDNELLKNNQKTHEKIKILRAFPYSDKNRYILLNDQENEEIGIIKDVKLLDSKSQKIVINELKKKYFIPKILKVHSIELQRRVPCWNVQTNKGNIIFKVRRSRNIKFVASNHLVIKDNNGNKYEIPDITKLDIKSKKLIENEI